MSESHAVIIEVGLIQLLCLLIRLVIMDEILPVAVKVHALQLLYPFVFFSQVLGILQIPQVLRYLEKLIIFLITHVVEDRDTVIKVESEGVDIIVDDHNIIYGDVSSEYAQVLDVQF